MFLKKKILKKWGAVQQMVEMYRPLVIKNALVNGVFNEDLYQELMLELLRCIQSFKVWE